MSQQVPVIGRWARCGVASIALVLWACGARSDLDLGAQTRDGSLAPSVEAGELDSARPDASLSDARADGTAGDGAKDSGQTVLDANVLDANVLDASADAWCDMGTVVDAGCLLPSVSRVTSADSDPDDWFGSTVALSGDTLLVGAPHEGSGASVINGDPTDNSAPGSGAAYVFRRQGSDWVLQAYLKPGDNAADASFGGSVAISNDVAVVGAPYASSTGAAYLFARIGDVWTQVTAFYGPELAAGFGTSVALSGDTLVVGMPASVAAGEVHIFVRRDGQWNAQAVLRASHTSPYDRFGNSVAIANDVIVVGAPGDDSDALGTNGDESNNGATDSGAVHVFVRDGEAWTRQAYLKPLAPAACFHCSRSIAFGGSVATRGNLVVVGASTEESGALGINGANTSGPSIGGGAVYMFARDDGQWAQVTHVRPQVPDEVFGFGTSVAVSDQTLVIGAAFAAGANDRAYLFGDEGGRLTERFVLLPPPGASFDGGRFGMSVATSGTTIAVGSWGDDFDRGAVYVFEAR